MKITQLEELGLRCISQLARAKRNQPVTIPEIAEKEGISVDYATKLMTILRRLGFIRSIRGVKGGYTLIRKPEEISIGEILKALGGFALQKDICANFPGGLKDCPHSVDCGIRAVWIIIAKYVSGALDHLSLADVIKKEKTVAKEVRTKLRQQVRKSSR